MLTGTDADNIGDQTANEEKSYFYTNRLNFFVYAEEHQRRYLTAKYNFEKAVENLHGLRGQNVWAVLTGGVTFLRRYLEMRKEKTALINFVMKKVPEVRSAYSSDLVTFEF